MHTDTSDVYKGERGVGGGGGIGLVVIRGLWGCSMVVLNGSMYVKGEGKCLLCPRTGLV